jgi:hypothetical protein
MPNTTPPPPLTAWCDLPAQMAAAGFAVLDADATCRMAGWTELPVAWYAFWRDLPPDRYLRDGGRYRRRRHGCFTIDGAQLRLMPHRAIGSRSNTTRCMGASSAGSNPCRMR